MFQLLPRRLISNLVQITFKFQQILILDNISGFRNRLEKIINKLVGRWQDRGEIAREV